MSNSKIGVQSQSGIIQDANKLLAKHPIAYKLLGNALSLDFAKRIRASSPDTLIILRAQPGNWSLGAGVVDYANRAMQIAAPFLSANACDLLESPNEPVVNNDTDAKRLNEQQVQLAGIYKTNGYQCLGYNFPVGNPPYELWQYLNDGVVACNGWVGLHEYGAPTIQSNAADLSLRHRKVLPLLSAAARSVFKVVVSECGLDFGIGRPPDSMPTSGGYRAMPAQGDSEDYWIHSYTAQLEWWDSELAKDAYVIASTVYGYAMEHPWETFDVARIDTDRAFYIAWQPSGKAVIPPNGGSVPITPAEKIATIPFLVKRAIQLDLGPSIYGEYDAKAADNTLYHAWIWQRGGVIVRDGDYGDLANAKLFNPQTGEPMSVPLPWPGSGVTPIPPPTIKRLTTADLPPELGLEIVPVNMPKGSKQWYIVQAGGWKQNVGTELIVHCIPLSGPAFDIPVTNRFASGAEKQKTDGAGNVKFDFGHGSAFSPPALPPNTIYAAWPGDQIMPIGDRLLFGFIGGAHLEGNITMQEVPNT